MAAMTTGSICLSSGSASTLTSGGSRPESGCWQQQQQQQQVHNNHGHPHNQLYDATPMSPRRNDLAASPASQMSRRGSAAGGGRPPPSTPPLALKVLLPGSSGDFSDAADAVADVLGSSSLGCGGGGGGGSAAVMSSAPPLHHPHINHQPLPSLVPDGDDDFNQDPQQLLLLARPPPSASRSRSRAPGSPHPQGPLNHQNHHHQHQQNQPEPTSWGLGLEAVRSTGSRTGTAGAGMGLLSSRLPSSGCGSTSTSNAPPGTEPRGMQLPSTPSGSCRSVPDRSLRVGSSEATQQQQPQRSSSLLGSRGAALGVEAGGGAAATAAGVAPAVLAAAEPRVSSSSYKSQMRRLQGAVSALGGGGVEDGCLGDDNFDGAGNAEDDGGNAGGCCGAGAQRLTQLREQSSGGSSLDDAAPPRRAGTTAWGPLAESAPGSLGPGGSFADVFGGHVASGPLSSPSSRTAKPATASNGTGTGTSIGYSRRSPAASSSPVQPPQPSVLRWPLGSAAAAISASGTASPYQEVSAPPLQPHPPSTTSMTIHSTGSSRSVGLAVAVGALLPANPSIRPSPAAAEAATTATKATAPKPPPLQRLPSQSIGFSRRPEDLPAAPSPFNSRSLARGCGGCSSSSSGGGGGGGGTNSTPASWCSPRTPPSPAASDAAGRSGYSRRLEDLPAAPSPGQSRSLRPDSSRAVFRSHASGPAKGSVTSPVPPAPGAWGQPIGGGGGGGGLVLSLGSPSPVATSSSPLSCGAASSGQPLPRQHQHQQRGLQADGSTDDVIDLPVVQGDIK
ncbi:hypothetical protein VOLCADRAFT_99579 [Volvox carteri f. nagariensis]|uniref:Uncharacterized protein n=1 Tax=Volvox carteri f. nagariensis TaxID=3068 RepID=D8UI37_VOLCA|nr:uncharacterized protein VOLCADRAFT_99579 [Volvox carteri f. nagariensis]EFJ40604.1 hypothetical protein VOLCADRAFT_99579 [Volvox carteri f. nagariensis]|eukprot:XP_002958311.1 hypothetical protein VOLCADRAFT_99579 [Volvox carteri f. nagariensis]